MNITGIEELIEKYYEGETSLKEEALLMDFFLGDDIPPHLAVHAEHFRLLNMIRKEEIHDPDFDRKVIENPGTITRYPLNITPRRFIYLTSLVASVLLLAGLLITFRHDIMKNLTTKRLSEQYTSPETAYAAATKALLLVSVNLNSGLDHISRIDNFGRGVKSIEPFSKFSKYQPLKINQAERKTQPIKK